MIKFKKGFTIVELVIVIAVIAILAAVLIPTFGNVIEKARVANDTAVCRNINTLLATDEAKNGKPATQAEAFTRLIDVAEEGGYLLENLTPMSTGDILYDYTANRIVLVNFDSGTVIYKDAASTTVDDTFIGSLVKGGTKPDTLFMIYDDSDSASASQYVNYIYKKVATQDTLVSSFTNASLGVVAVSGNITFSTTTDSSKLVSVSEITGNATNVTVQGASGTNSTSTLSSTDSVEVYIASGKTFRIAEGTTVNIGDGVKIVHDGTILLYGTLNLTGTWYKNYYRSTNSANTDISDFFVIKSTGYLSMPGAGAGGWRTVSAESGAQIDDGYYIWQYTGEGWKVAGNSSATVNGSTTYAAYFASTMSEKSGYCKTETANYIWKFVCTGESNGVVSGYWMRKAVDNGTWENSTEVPYGCNLYQTYDSQTPSSSFPSSN